MGKHLNWGNEKTLKPLFDKSTREVDARVCEGYF